MPLPEPVQWAQGTYLGNAIKSFWTSSTTLPWRILDPNLFIQTQENLISTLVTRRLKSGRQRPNPYSLVRFWSKSRRKQCSGKISVVLAWSRLKWDGLKEEEGEWRTMNTGARLTHQSIQESSNFVCDCRQYFLSIAESPKLTWRLRHMHRSLLTRYYPPSPPCSPMGTRCASAWQQLDLVNGVLVSSNLLPKNSGNVNGNFL